MHAETSSADTGYEVVIRPRRGGREDRSRLRYGFAFLPMVAVGVIRQIDAHPARGVYWLAGAASAFILALVLRAESFARTSLRLSATAVERTGTFGRAGGVRRDAVAEVVEVEVVVARFGGLPTRFLLLLDADGRALLRVHASLYDDGDLLRFRDALGAPWRSLPGVRTMAKVRKQVPGAFPWLLAHVYVSTLLLIALVSVALASAR